MRFSGKTMLVTGAGSGIGAATAMRLSDEGARLILVDIASDNLARTCKDLDKRDHVALTLDICDPAQIDTLAQRVRSECEKLDAVVNAAGIAGGGGLADVAPETWRKTFAVNVDGPYLIIRGLMPLLIASKGCIVNVASVSGLGGDWNNFTYNAAKGALINMTRALALDHGRDGVRINAVCPSLTRTPLVRHVYDDPQRLHRFIERVPMGRMAEPAEIASVIAFLASADASFVTGVAMAVDGGLTASNGQPAPARLAD